MLFFKKKSKAESNKKDRDLIEANSQKMDALIVLAEEELKQDLEKIKEEIKYIIPLTDDKAYKMDEKMRNLIDDIKIELVKDKSTVKVANLIKDLRVMIAERKALV